MEAFKKLGISEQILKSISEMKFEKPTEIQERTIPFVLGGKDVIAGASTGSGKTLAFGTGIIEHCDKGMGIQALVLTPTRELAEQITQSLKQFSKFKHLEFTSVYGGVSINPQIRDLNYADVVVGTPGRILDHIERRTIELRNVRILVLDEADRMLDMGFIDDVKRIIERCPKHRQTLLFSATMAKDIVRLSKDYMNAPLEVFAESNVDPTKLTQIYYDVEDNEKFSLLVHLVRNDKTGLVMVFCNTQRNTDFVAKNLQLVGINALPIHGGHSQDKRDKAMDKFHAKEVHVLVCTDVAARGLDIKGVSHVYNYDSPNESSQYIHRIGRTARAGEEGKAVNIIGGRDYENFGRIMKENPGMIKREEPPQFENVPIQFKHRSSFDRRGDSRGSRFGGRGGSSFRGRNDRGDGRGSSRGNQGRGNSRFNRHDNRASRHNRHSRF